MKDGKHTTEFWLTLILMIVGGVHDILQLFIFSGYAAPWGIVTAGVSAVLYERGRRALKLLQGQPVELPDLEPPGAKAPVLKPRPLNEP